MKTLRVEHRTSYQYERPVSFGPHRLMLRPRDGHDLRILESALSIWPPAEVRWEFDTFGNSIAFASFKQESDRLTIESTLLLRRYGYDGQVTRLAYLAAPYPFRYSEDEMIDLAPLLRLHSPHERDTTQRWLDRVIATPPSGSMQALEALNRCIHDTFRYRRREEPGVQTPAETIARGEGSCRDFALLFIEAARLLGFAARFVTGYLYDPAADAAQRGGAALTGGGATHVWADIFVPGAGWIDFDPTNDIVGGNNLIRVATTRTPSQAVPVRGTYSHDGVRCTRMDVIVSLMEIDHAPAAVDADYSGTGTSIV